MIPTVRRLGRRQRGLAEIVGTLMLVVIVVAAATAFSFFVASYQAQVQAEETAAHNKALEDLKILSLAPTINHETLTLADLQIELASLDPNPTVITGMTINSEAVANYTVTDSSGSPLANGCFNAVAYSGSNSSCTLTVPAEAQTFLEFNLTFKTPLYAFGPATVSLGDDGLLDFKSFTSLGNEFTQSFVPPVAVAQVSFVGSFPVLDGSGSYQPSSGSGGNATVDSWQWDVDAPDASPASVPAGETSEVGTVAFPVPSGYTPVDQAVVLSVFTGSAGGGSVASPAKIISNQIVGTTDLVSFDFKYDAPSGGWLRIAGATLYDNSSTELPTTGVAAGVADLGSYFGQQVELANYLTPLALYQVWLNVTNSQSLVGTTHIDYTLE